MSVVEDGQQRKKRIRKRKSRTRNDNVEDQGNEESVVSFSEKVQQHNDDDDDDQEHVKKASKVAESSHQDKVDDEKDKTENEGKEKRKRKRTRGKSKKEQNENEISAASASIIDKDAGIEEKAKDTESMKLYLEGLGDPHSHNDILNEKTKNALSYTRQFHLDRANWKFNKAKQEFLIRHMFTLPAVEKAELAAAAAEEEANKDNDENEEKEIESLVSQYWPDEWNRCVAKYFVTIQGQAKQRLFDTLTRASQQVIPVQLPKEPTSSVINQAKDSDITSEKKTVSFGDVAMAYDANNDIQKDSSTYSSAADIQRLQFQKSRAEALLSEMDQVKLLYL